MLIIGQHFIRSLANGFVAAVVFHRQTAVLTMQWGVSYTYNDYNDCKTMCVSDQVCVCCGLDFVR